MVTGRNANNHIHIRFTTHIRT